jgi:hypothetical protein
VEGGDDSSVQFGEAKAAAESTIYQVRVVDSPGGPLYDCIAFEGRVRVTGFGTTRTLGHLGKVILAPGTRNLVPAKATEPDIRQAARTLARKDLALAVAGGSEVSDNEKAVRKIANRRIDVLRDPTDVDSRLQLVNTLLDIGAVKAVPYQLERVNPEPGNRVAAAQKTLAENRIGRPVNQERLDDALQTMRSEIPAAFADHKWLGEFLDAGPPPEPPDEVQQAFDLIRRRNPARAQGLLLAEERKGYQGAEIDVGFALASIDMRRQKEAIDSALKAMSRPPGATAWLDEELLKRFVGLSIGDWSRARKLDRGWGSLFLDREMPKAAMEVYRCRLRLGSKDPRDYYGAGLAAEALGDRRSAASWMKKAKTAKHARRYLTGKQLERAESAKGRE